MKTLFLIIGLLPLLLSCQKKPDTQTVVQGEEIIAKEVVLVEDARDGDEIENQQEQIVEQLPFIDKKVSSRLAPKMKRWLSAYKLDINKFKIFETDEMDDWDKDKETIYYKEFDPEEDNVYLPQLRDYSPDRSLFVNIPESLVAYLENDTLKYYGGEDCQEIYLTSRTLKKKVMIVWLGAGGGIHDCFWVDNSSFILVGHGYLGHLSVFFTLYNLADNTKTRYVFEDIDSQVSIDYFREYNLPFRGRPLLMD